MALQIYILSFNANLQKENSDSFLSGKYLKYLKTKFILTIWSEAEGILFEIFKQIAVD